MLSVLLILCSLPANVRTLRFSNHIEQGHSKSSSDGFCQPGVLEGFVEEEEQLHRVPKLCDAATEKRMQNLTVGDFIAEAQRSVEYAGINGYEDSLQPEPYPLTPERIRQAVRPEGHIGSWRRVADKLLQATREKRKPRIAVLGGSMTKGRGLSNWVKPWPIRLKRVLWPIGGAKVQNLAEGGHSSAHSLFMLSLGLAEYKKSDIIIIDYAVNDFSEDGRMCCGMPDATSCSDFDPCNRVPNPVLYPYRNGTRQPPTQQLERLVRILLNLPQRPAVLFLETFQHDLGYSCDTNIKQHVHWPLIKKFDMPVVSYKAAMCATGSTFWQHGGVDHAGPHPGSTTHELVAHMVGAALYSQMRRSCRDPNEMHDHVGIKQFDQRVYECLVAPTAQIVSHFPKIRKEGWEFIEDVEGKPGWVAPADGMRHIIDYPFRSAQGVVTIEYLSSYENVGTSRCWLLGPGNDPGKFCDIDARWKDRSSQSSYMTLSMPTTPEAGNNNMYRLKCESDGSKFKILAVTAC